MTTKKTATQATQVPKDEIATQAQTQSGSSFKAATTGDKPTGARFGSVVKGRGELPPFIPPSELEEFDSFTIIGARRGTSKKYGHAELLFDVAIQVPKSDEFPTGVRRGTVTLKEDDTRAEVYEAVKQHKFLTNVRIDRISIEGNANGYWKFVDAETPRPEDNAGGESDSASSGVDVAGDDDIPF